MSRAPIRSRRTDSGFARRIALALLMTCCVADARGAWGYSSYSVRLFGTGGGTQRDRIKVRIDPATPADVGASDFTVELWMRGTLGGNVRPTAGYRPDGQAESANVDWIYGNILVDRDLYGGGPDWGVSVHRDGPADDRGVLRFGTEGGNGAAHTLQGRIHVLDGAWHHVALVRERETGVKRIYVDGELDVASAAGASTADLSYPDGRNSAYPDSDPFLVFGAEKHGDEGTSAYPSFAGWIDEIRVWHVARTQAAIAAARTQALAGNTAGLALYLRLEEGTGQNLADATAAGSGVLYGGTTGQGEWSNEVPPGGSVTTSSTIASTSTTTSTTSSTVQVPVPSSTSTTSTSSTSTTRPPVSTSTMVTASTTTTTAPAGLVAAYGFEEAAGTAILDASGNGHTGTLVGAAAATRDASAARSSCRVAARGQPWRTARRWTPAPS
jgi:hypothetical protein